MKTNFAMWKSIAHKLLLISCVLVTVHSSDPVTNSNSRQEKHFSLFSVVTFKNEQCTSLSTLAGNAARTGTCYTTTECSDKGGTTSGNCASGFGVCCIFLNTAAVTSSITENRTLIRNKEYPSVTTATAATSIIYTIKKMQSDICQIRLDFHVFVIGGPVNSLENSVAATTMSHCANDNMVIGATDGELRGKICGALTGEHLYVELSPTSTDEATITISTVISTTLLPATAKRTWDIQANQIPCYASYRAPHGCDRYLMTSTGKITSLNFWKVSGSTPAAQTTSAGQNTGIELMLQNINTCIRRAKGMCCVQYQVCAADTQGILLTDSEDTAEVNTGVEGVFNEGWSIDTDVKPFFTAATMNNMGLVDAMCNGDYVGIPSSFSGPCGGSTGSAANTINSRYCGAKFGAYLWASTTISTSMPVCDCSEPFHVRHVTDTANDAGASVSTAINNVNGVVPPRGFCLDFTQSPCWTR